MASPLYDHENNPRGFIEIIEDISERKHVESELREYQEQLRSMASKLTLGEEQERRRIASGLHDSIIQPLAFIKMKLETLLKKEETGDELMASLRRMLDETSGLMAMTRGFTFELSYPILYEFGLEAAMDEWLREEIREKHGLEIVFNDDSEDKPLEDDMRSFLFGAFRELLVNVIKHAEATKINVAVSREGDKIAICVKDDGVGFDYVQRRPVLAKDSGFGLFGIRDRLEYLGGDFKIESEVGSGTVVVLRAPLRQGT
jgi:signal transduction histidine kinase